MFKSFIDDKNRMERKGEKWSEIEYIVFLFRYLTSLMRKKKRNDNNFLLDPQFGGLKNEGFEW